MSFKNRIVLKTDASTRNGEGFGIAFQADTYDQFGCHWNFSGKQFIDCNAKSTQAETIAVVFAIRELQEWFEGNKLGYMKDYTIIIESDCEHTVEIIRGEKRGYNVEIEQAIDHYGRLCETLRARWIPRADNTIVDAMARETFRRGVEGEL